MVPGLELEAQRAGHSCGVDAGERRKELDSNKAWMTKGEGQVGTQKLGKERRGACRRGDSCKVQRLGSAGRD